MILLEANSHSFSLCEVQVFAGTSYFFKLKLLKIIVYLLIYLFNYILFIHSW